MHLPAAATEGALVVSPIGSPTTVDLTIAPCRILSSAIAGCSAIDTSGGSGGDALVVSPSAWQPRELAAAGTARGCTFMGAGTARLTAAMATAVTDRSTAAVRVRCAVTDPGVTYARSEFTVQLARAFMPRIRNVAILSADGNVKMVWQPDVNATALAALPCFAVNATAAAVDGGLPPQDYAAPALPAACGELDALLGGLADAAEGSGSGDTEAAGPFGLVIGGARHLAVVMDTALPDDMAVNVTIGGVLGTVLWRSASGKVLHVASPPWDAVCPRGATECGYKTLAVVPGAVSSGMPLAATACPPFCPRLYPGTVPFRTSTGNLLPSVARGVGQVPDPVAAATEATVGIFYAAACSAESGSHFTDPATGACTNASDPRSANCAYGSGDSCRRCPRGALCPGGARMWPQRGYYTIAESVGVVMACAPPSLERCSGWDASITLSGCGAAYRVGSVACSACASRHYPDDNSACVTCPPGTDTWTVARPMVLLVCGSVAAFAVFWCVVWVIARAFGGTVTGGVSRVGAFVAFVINGMQVVSQVGQAATPGLPPIMRSFYSAFNVFQLEGVALPAGCNGNTPFLTPTIKMGAALMAVLGIVVFGLGPEALRAARTRACLQAIRVPPRVVAWLTAPRRSKEASDAAAPATQRGARAMAVRIARRVQHTVLKVIATAYKVALLVLYPIATNAALRLVRCTTVDITVRGYNRLDNDGTSLARYSAAVAASGSVVITTSVLEDNPWYVCYEARHGEVVGLAWATLVLYTIGFPVVSWLWVRQRVALHVQADASGAAARLAAARTADAAARAKYVRTSWLASARVACCGPYCTYHRRPDKGSPLKSEPAAAESVAAPPQLPSTVLDNWQVLARDPLLAPFTASDYRISAWWQRHVDMVAMSTLSLLLVFWASPTTPMSVVGKAMTTVASTSIVLFFLLTRQPYDPVHTWKSHVRSYILVVTAMAAITNGVTGYVAVSAAVAAATGDANTTPDLTTLVVALSYTLAALSVGLFGWLLWHLGRSMVTGAKREKRAALYAKAKAARRQTFLAGFAAKAGTGAGSSGGAAAAPSTPRDGELARAGGRKVFPHRGSTIPGIPELDAVSTEVVVGINPLHSNVGRPNPLLSVPTMPPGASKLAALDFAAASGGAMRAARVQMLKHNASAVGGSDAAADDAAAGGRTGRYRVLDEYRHAAAGDRVRGGRLSVAGPAAVGALPAPSGGDAATGLIGTGPGTDAASNRRPGQLQRTGASGRILLSSNRRMSFAAEAALAIFD